MYSPSYDDGCECSCGFRYSDKADVATNAGDGYKGSSESGRWDEIKKKSARSPVRSALSSSSIQSGAIGGNAGEL